MISYSDWSLKRMDTFKESKKYSNSTLTHSPRVMKPKVVNKPLDEPPVLVKDTIEEHNEDKKTKEIIKTLEKLPALIKDTIEENNSEKTIEDDEKNPPVPVKDTIEELINIESKNEEKQIISEDLVGESKTESTCGTSNIKSN